MSIILPIGVLRSGYVIIKRKILASFFLPRGKGGLGIGNWGLRVKQTRESLEHALMPLGAQALEKKLALRRLAGAVKAFDGDEGAAARWGDAGKG